MATIRTTRSRPTHMPRSELNVRRPSIFWGSKKAEGDSLEVGRVHLNPGGAGAGENDSSPPFLFARREECGGAVVDGTPGDAHTLEEAFGSAADRARPVLFTSGG